MVQKLNYRSKGRGSPNPSFSWDMQELLFPLIFMGLGFAIIAAELLFQRHAASVGLAMAIVMIVVALETVIGIVAAFITASIMGSAFGELRTAAVKLAAVIIFTAAISDFLSVGGIFGTVIVLIIYGGLLMWFFDLQKYEVVVFTFVFLVMRIVVVMAVASMFS